MLSRLGIFFMIAVVAGCTSTGTTIPTSKMYPGCDEPIWSWCLAKQAR